MENAPPELVNSFQEEFAKMKLSPKFERGMDFLLRKAGMVRIRQRVLNEGEKPEGRPPVFPMVSVVMTTGMGVVRDQARRRLGLPQLVQFESFLLEQFEFTKKKLTAMPPGEMRGQMVLHLIDQTLSLDAKERPAATAKVSCKAGCSACCHRMVEVTDDEAAVLAAVVRDRTGLQSSTKEGAETAPPRLNLEKLRERWHAQAGYEKWQSLDYWRAPKHVRACAFLDSDERCSVYEYRPALCRVHAVTTAPSACAADDPKIKLHAVMGAELIASAAFAEFGESKTLAQAMLHELGPPGALPELEGQLLLRAQQRTEAGRQSLLRSMREIDREAMERSDSRFPRPSGANAAAERTQLTRQRLLELMAARKV